MNKRDDILVFLGPSLPVKQAEKIVNATFFPPAEQGDIIGFARQFKPKVIALIDGIFHSKPSVWHKEILYALDQGIHVYGASSMGALRAAETDTFGMQGVGKIYQQFATGELLDDDEVALIHDGLERDFRPLTEPMVNVRATLIKASSEGIINDWQYESLIKIAKDIYFAKRTRTAIFNQAVAQGILSDSATIKQYFENNYVDLKRNDAVELLNIIKELPIDIEPFKPDFEFTNHRLVQSLLSKDAYMMEGKTKITNGDVMAYHALHDPNFESLNFNALNRGLVMILADLLEVEVDENAIIEERRRFKIKHNLLKDDSFQQWLKDNHVDEKSFNELMQQKAICRKMHRWLAHSEGKQGSLRLLTEELILNNRYSKFIKQAVIQQEVLDQAHSFIIEEQICQEDNTQTLVREHLKSVKTSMDQNYFKWHKEANFSNIPDMEFHLIKSKLSRQALLKILDFDQD